ncbi:SDR family NAD(P)-dependent oxidoreductase [Bacillus dakarensis]|uniref:SDR family NAD(P)-dependent oxidoreductase n=1 Tax=Robertmurraya dakarensis TaxID=1926278 RepID=UPI000A01AD1A|nr:SDR family NAD(P)-dependent oxidoreductase [Bacillus dakarensis]
MNLHNSVSWITGAAGGIGQATCHQLANAGSHLVITDLDFEKVNDLASVLKEKGVEVLPLQLDVSDQSAVEQAGKQIREKFGRLDILVNGAGISPKGPNGRVPIEQLSSDEWLKVLNINLNGAFYCSQVAARMMKEAGKGHIVNIASQAGRTFSSITAAHYSVSKAGIIALTRQLAGELGEHGIYANAVAPGRIDTPMIRDVAKEVNERVIAKTPLGRLGTPEEVAKTILFLASDYSSFITGTVVDVNGGTFIA